MADEKTIDDIKKEIVEQVIKLVGNINNIDSKKEKADITLTVLNEVVAGVDLSKIEKAGTLAYLMDKRIKG